jgi:hypothetical protein
MLYATENHRPVASHWQLYHLMLHRLHLDMSSIITHFIGDRHRFYIQLLYDHDHNHPIHIWNEAHGLTGDTLTIIDVFFCEKNEDDNYYFVSSLYKNIFIHVIRKLWRFKSDSMISFKIEGQTTQWTKEKGQTTNTNIASMRKSERTSQLGIQNVLGQHYIWATRP